jgi:hypothetical protein
MTQALDALDVDRRLAGLDRARTVGAPTSATQAKVSAFGTFAITFGIAFAIIYTLLERFNWPLFTYFPSLNELDFWKAAPRPGAGPPMYWYGWLANSVIAAFVVGLVATAVPAQWLRRATVFSCILATFWVAVHAVASFLNEWAYLQLDFLDSIWVAAIPAVLVAAIITARASDQGVDRAWRNSLLLMPIAGLVVLGYSLQQYFTH